MLAAIVVCGLGYAEGGLLARHLGGWQVISWALLLALPVMLPMTVLMRPASFTAVGASAWWALGYVAVFSMLIGFLFWYRGLAQGGIAAVGQLQLLQPFFGLALAALLLHESVSLSMVLVTLVAVICVAGARRFSRQEKGDEKGDGGVKSFQAQQDHYDLTSVPFPGAAEKVRNGVVDEHPQACTGMAPTGPQQRELPWCVGSVGSTCCRRPSASVGCEEVRHPGQAHASDRSGQHGLHVVAGHRRGKARPGVAFDARQLPRMQLSGGGVTEAQRVCMRRSPTSPGVPCICR